MSTTARPTPQATPPELQALLVAVNDARAQVELERAAGNDAACARARVQLLHALETYADALAARGGTLPHRMRVELNLHRLLHDGR